MQHDIFDDEDKELVEEEKPKDAKVQPIIRTKSFVNSLINVSVICQESEVKDVDDL